MPSAFGRPARASINVNIIGMDAEMQVAEQTIYHSAEYPSHVVLPIIPRE